MPAELRAYADRQREENERLRRQLMEDRLGSIGLNKEAGVGKAIFKDLEKGDYEGELTIDAIRSYAATEYGHEAKDESQNRAAEVTDRANALDSAQVPQTPPQDPNDRESVIREAEQAVRTENPSRQDVERSIGAKLRGFVADHMT
jgi:hypothetical protein